MSVDVDGDGVILDDLDAVLAASFMDAVASVDEWVEKPWTDSNVQHV